MGFRAYLKTCFASAEPGYVPPVKLSWRPIQPVPASPPKPGPTLDPKPIPTLDPKPAPALDPKPTPALDPKPTQPRSGTDGGDAQAPPHLAASLAAELAAAHAHAQVESDALERCRSELANEQTQAAELEMMLVDLWAPGQQAAIAAPALAELDLARSLKAEAARAHEEALALREEAAAEEHAIFEVPEGGGIRILGCSLVKAETRIAESEAVLAAQLERRFNEEALACQAVQEECDGLRDELRDLSRRVKYDDQPAVAARHATQRR